MITFISARLGFKHFATLLLLCCAVVTVSCSRTTSADVEDVAMADTLTHHARLLTIVERPDGVVRVDIADPWSENALLGSYALVDRDSVVPNDLPDGVAIIRTPVQKAAVFSTIHTSVFKELGAIDLVAAVADGAYFPENDTISSLIKSGGVVDVGSSMQPSAELLIASGAEIVLTSPMQGATINLPQNMVPVAMADYMENAPIARAEWILLLGELSGKRNLARDIFDSVIDHYSELVFKVTCASSKHPKVLIEVEQSGVWYVSAGESYMAQMLSDAGAEWPWADTKGAGSLALNLEAVAQKALDADLWLVRSYGYETTKESLAAMNPRYKAFKAWRDGNILSCNTAERNIFDATAFHPDEVLAEYVAIFHPEVLPDYELKYFRRTVK